MATETEILARAALLGCKIRNRVTGDGGWWIHGPDSVYCRDPVDPLPDDRPDPLHNIVDPNDPYCTTNLARNLAEFEAFLDVYDADLFLHFYGIPGAAAAQLVAHMEPGIYDQAIATRDPVFFPIMADYVEEHLPHMTDLIASLRQARNNNDV